MKNSLNEIDDVEDKPASKNLVKQISRLSYKIASRIQHADAEKQPVYNAALNLLTQAAVVSSISGLESKRLLSLARILTK